MRSLEWRLLAWQALDEAMPVFPVYALLFADAGLSLWARALDRVVPGLGTVAPTQATSSSVA